MCKGEHFGLWLLGIHEGRLDTAVRQVAFTFGTEATGEFTQDYLQKETGRENVDPTKFHYLFSEPIN